MNIKSLFNIFKSNNNLPLEQKSATPQSFDSLLYSASNNKKKNQDIYATSSDVYSIVRKIAQTASLIPLKLYEYNRSGEKTEVQSGSFWHFLNQPNREQNLPDFIESTISYLLLTGNTVILKDNLDTLSYTKELLPLPAQYVTTNKEKFFDEITKYHLELDKKYTFEQDKIIHVKYFSSSKKNINNGLGQSPLQAAFNIVDSLQDLRNAEQNLLKNNAASGILSADSDIAMTAEELQEHQQAFNRKFGGSSEYAKIVFSNQKLKFQRIGLSGAELEIFKTQDIKLRNLCNVYNVSSSLLNDPSSKTYNNYSEAQKDFYQGAVLPNLFKIVEALNKNVLPEWEKRDRKSYWIEIDTSKIDCLQENKKEQSDIIISHLEAGIITTEEARIKLGYSE